jgi:tight adherence protein B
MNGEAGTVLTGKGGALVIALLVLVAAVAIVWGVSILVLRDRRPRLEDTLSPYRLGRTAERDAPRTAGSSDLVETPLLQRAVNALAKVAAKRGVLQYLERKLDQAELPVRPAEAFFLYVVVTGLATVLGLLLGGVFWGIGTGAVVGVVPWFVLDYLAVKRRDQFTAQLPDMLQLLATTLRSGFSILQGLDTVARQIRDPAGGYMRTVVREARLGRPLIDALSDVARRIRSDDFEWVVQAIAIQREVGGNLAELLDIVADTMNARARLRREVRTLTAEGRIGAIIISILPIAIGLFVWAVNPDYIIPLFHSTSGEIAFYGSIVLGVLGIAWIRQIVRIEV